MKANWVFFGFLAVELLLVGVLVGSMTVTGASTDAPHGLLEYWFNRNQTILAAALALGGAWFGARAIHRQVAVSQAQHTAIIYEGRRNELDALEGITTYCDQLGRERAGAFKNGRDLTIVDMNLTYRVSMFVHFSMSSAFSQLCDEVSAYNASDRRSVIMYGGDETGETEHGARCSLLFGVASVIGQSARNRITQIQALAPSTQTVPSAIL